MTLLLSVSLITSLNSGCTFKQLKVDDVNITAHWMKKTESAPFDGILLNDYTYMQLRLKLIESEANK